MTHHCEEGALGAIRGLRLFFCEFSIIFFTAFPMGWLCNNIGFRVGESQENVGSSCHSL